MFYAEQQKSNPDPMRRRRLSRNGPSTAKRGREGGERNDDKRASILSLFPARRSHVPARWTLYSTVTCSTLVHQRKQNNNRVRTLIGRSNRSVYTRNRTPVLIATVSVIGRWRGFIEGTSGKKKMRILKKKRKKI